MSLKIGTGYLYSQQDMLPHYLTFNRFGQVEQDGIFGYLTAYLGKEVARGLQLQSGLELRNGNLSKLDIGLSHKDWYLSIGKSQRVFGGHSPELVSGSLALGNNAMPIPSIQVGLENFKPVPLTGTFFKFKGHFFHGSLDDQRIIQKARLHSKSFYLMLDLRKELGLDISSGLIHFAMYGGIDESGNRLPSSFSDYSKVFLGQGIPNELNTTAGEANAVGNHLGIIETTINKKLGKYNLRINYQGPFEDKGGLQYISGTDGLLSLELSRTNEGKIIDKIYVEYLQTKWQSGPGLPDGTDQVSIPSENFGYRFGGRDDYFNNWLYRSGWTYHGFTLSNPLYLTHSRLQEVFPGIPSYGAEIANNRIAAIHLGIKGFMSSKLLYRALFTVSDNYGTYAGRYDGRFNWGGIRSSSDFNYEFLVRRRQFNSLLELNFLQILGIERLSAKVLMSLDRGRIYDNFGTEIGFFYSLGTN